ncbi:MAG: hypothetical protein ACR2RB_10765 [Gammaproteobacteria bacterium]
MPTIPDFVYLMGTVEGESFADTAGLFLDAFAHADLPAVEQWSIPSDHAKQSGTAAKAKAFIAAAGAGPDVPVNGIFEMGDEVTATIFHRRRDRAGRYGLRLSKTVGAARHAEMLDFLARATEACRYVLRHGRVLQLCLFREGGGLSSVPVVPLVYGSSHLTVVTTEQVDGAYREPAMFWRAGWDADETCDDQRLLLRGLDIEAGPDYLAQIIPHQWAMARAAKPGLTKYYLPQVEPEEERVYRAGAPTLDIVGHLAGENLVEFSCALEPGQHINGWEIFNLYGLIQAGELPDGRQVDVVRVVFLECATAEQEKRPLLDIGARVYCYDDAGELIEISD